ncbi:hypothetical protein J6590_066097 [Homalodisca vitripennis]|nr:hypothetical protein J6590_066097 [Homalodisca vitripennis]
MAKRAKEALYILQKRKRKCESWKGFILTVPLGSRFLGWGGLDACGARLREREALKDQLATTKSLLEQISMMRDLFIELCFGFQHCVVVNVAQFLTGVHTPVRRPHTLYSPAPRPPNQHPGRRTFNSLSPKLSGVVKRYSLSLPSIEISAHRM